MTAYAELMPLIGYWALVKCRRIKDRQMKIFREGEYINKYFGICYERLRKKIAEYSYIQLKDFSDEEIKSFAQLGEIEEVILDFDNQKYETEFGKMQEYSGFRNYNGNREYYLIDALNVIANIQILQGRDYIRYKPREEIYFIGGTETEVTLRQEGSQLYFYFTMQFPSDEMKKLSSTQQKWEVDKKYKENIYTIQQRMEALNKEIKVYNSSLFEFVKNEIKKKVDSDSLLAGFSSAIGVQLISKQENKENGNRISIVPKKFEPHLPEIKTFNGYYFDKQNYYLILKIIREHIKATEILPKPVQKLSDEELIRDTILWALNENFIVATGETFRAAGKTDISVNFEDRSAFIAECKIWRGGSTFDSALTQLYSYLTWRDCKVALLFFNLEYRDFGLLLDKIEEQISNHKNFISKTKKANNEWECVFRKEADYSENLTLNIFVADYCLRK